MHCRFISIALLAWAFCSLSTAEPFPAPQDFLQEFAANYPAAEGKLKDVQLVDIGGTPRAFASGRWFEIKEGRWTAIPELQAKGNSDFPIEDASGNKIALAIPWREVRQVLRTKSGLWVATSADPFIISDGRARSLGWPSRNRVNQIAADREGRLWIASSGGLFRQTDSGWSPVGIPDGLGRGWGVVDVLGVAFDQNDRLWFATKAGVGCRTDSGWRFFEGKDGVPWNDFTGIAIAADGVIWFGTHLGVVRFDGIHWHYRQGPAWLPHDDARQIAIDSGGNAWIATPEGVGVIAFRKMSLAEKADFYESEIERYIKRTPLGFVAEAQLTTPGDKSTARSYDSDNDGLWTAMYGAGEAFSYAATKDPRAKERARKAFEALRFLQTVTQEGQHSPPKGYVARTIMQTDGPDPNEGRLARDREEQKGDRLWKVYEPRWPKSADGKWYWKSDTSSDELDGHYFFYPLYYEFCADSEDEKNRVREVVRDLTDHLIDHGFYLIDHDGKPTRWGIYGPQSLNNDPDWWGERGLNSLSILSYLAAAAFVTGDPKYEAASRELIDKHGYAQNLMFPKVQHGPGSGNQSDDEMAVMCFYSLLRYSRDESLKAQARYSFFRYWANEAPEMNPFFNFAYAAQNRDAAVTNVWGRFPIKPWDGWFEDSMTVLRGFPLDRINWPHQNSHRLDLQPLTVERSIDLYEPRRNGRGLRTNGKVLPIENRHFTHWNADPWRLDYHGNGRELGAGTVFLLPYYMGLYHGFIEKPR